MDTLRLILLMLVGTATGGILCFLNGLFKKPYLYLRNIVLLIVVGYFIAMNMGFSIRAKRNDLGWFITLLELTLPVIFSSSSIFLGMLDEKYHEMISMVLTGPLVFSLLQLATSTSLFACILIAFGTSVVLLGISIFYTKEYFSFECSICGAYLIAKLYTNCFYLQEWAFWAIFGLLTVGGTIFGIITKRRTKAQKD